ncbi:hypothetical protein PW5551_10410 [Petrotoga sp. 9PW.55.5.1]|uniref:hypothetical protein n=1 Tax=Petrotoga sp. 9PW.55.5.1 TaxID=1308979 RepID=UPI000DC4B8C0|nr:hypothetical protein [Petrotoga sp. 9PW.55.5.1]RAO98343.1 hypothetical protein PW5551_10410 [Petrotoga sp. 9PW.55.5.1]
MFRKVSIVLFVIINLTISANVYNNIEKIAQTIDTYNKKIIENQLNTQISERDNIKFNPIPSIGLTINQNSYNINFSNDLRNVLFMGKMEQEKEKEIVKAEFQKIDIEKEQIISIFSSILNYMNQKNILNLYNNYYNHFDQQEREIENEYKNKQIAYNNYLDNKIIISQYKSDYNNIKNSFELNKKQFDILISQNEEIKNISNFSFEEYIRYFLNTYYTSEYLENFVQKIQEINEFYFITLAPKYYPNIPTISTTLSYENTYDQESPNLAYTLRIGNQIELANKFSLKPEVTISYNDSFNFSLGLFFETTASSFKTTEMEDLDLLVSEQNNNQLMYVYNIWNAISYLEDSAKVLSMKLEQLTFLVSSYPDNSQIILEFLRIYSSLENTKANLAFNCFLLESEMKATEKKYELINNNVF